MSVIFLPPSAGAASVPDATETVSGKIRIATNAEATTGTDDTTAMTPAKTKTVVDAAVVGGVQYQGTFDASAPADLSNAEKGDLYVISGAGTYQGQVWAVGDHLLINEDMGGTVSPSKIDKVDNTDAVTSVAGKTGAVTLVPSDITGLATVASTGSYSDLSGTPTLGTAAAEDVGTLAGDVVQLDGSARLPAVDGSQLINLPSATVFYNTQIASLGPTLSQITDSRRQHYDIALCSPSNPITMPSATSAAVGGVVSFYNSDGVSQAVINCPTTLLLSGSSVTSITVEPYESRSFVWIGASALQEITATRIDRLNDVSISSPSGGEALVFNGTLSVFENAAVSASVAALDDIGDVTITSVSDREALVYDSASSEWINGSAANTVINAYNATGTAAAVSTQDLHIYRLYGSGGFSLTVSATEAGGLVMVNNISSSACTVTGPTFRRNGEGVSGGVTSITVEAGERRSFYLESVSLWLETTATNLDRLADVSLSSPSAGESLVYNGTLSAFQNATIAASVAALNDIGNVDTTGVTSNAVLQYDGADWVDGPVVGTGANNLVQLDGSARLPAVDGSQLLNLPSAIDRYRTSVSTSGTLPAINDNRRQHYDVIVAGLTVTIPNGGSSDVTGGIISVRNASSGNITYSGPATSWADGTSSGSKTLRPYQTGVLVWTSQYTTSEISNLYGTAAAEDVGTAASNVVQLDGSARLPAVDGSQLLNLPSAPVTSVAGKTGAVTLDLNDNTDVSYTPGAGIDNYVLTYDHATTSWGAEPSAGGGGGSAPSVTVSSPAVDQTLSAPSAGVIEEVYVYTPTTGITVNLVAAATVGSGFKYQIKNRSTNTITIDPNGSETVDGSATFALSVQESSVTLITDGSNWFII